MARAALVVPADRVARRWFVVLAAMVLLAAAGCLPPVRRPLTVWAVRGEEPLAADTLPALESEVFSASRGEITLDAAINETVGFQVALHTDAPPAGPFEIELTDLAGPRGMLSAATCVSRFRIQSVRMERFGSWYPEHVGRPATPTALPDILVPWSAPRGGGPLRLTGPANEFVWIDVRIPPTTDPGVYTGQLIVRPVAAEQLNPWAAAPPPAFACAVRLCVLPVALPSAPSLPVICRVDPGDLFAAHLGWPRETAEDIRVLPDSPAHEAARRLLNETMSLLHEHGTNPVLWACFPKYRPTGGRRVEIDWQPYDELVEGWLTGEAFADQVGLARWPIPASREHPGTEQEGGLDSPAYARLLAAYLAECRRHFAERGWLDRAFVRLNPPESLTPEAVAHVRRVGGIVRQSETNLPLVAHLPPESLRGLGWQNAPLIDVPDVGIWAPPAEWFEPAALAREQTLGRRAWLMPTYPPYSGTLSPAGLSTDAQILPWQAYRYGVDALWIEHAAEFGSVDAGWPPVLSPASECLIYPGSPYGLNDRPVPSLRLKRLRRGLQDHALLTLLARRGQKLAAERLAQQVVRWAGTDACLDHLLSCKPTGWPREARLLALARRLALRELAIAFDPAPGDDRAQIMDETAWGTLMNAATRVRAAVEGVRLQTTGDHFQARAYCNVLNLTNADLTGSWVLPAPPVGWTTPTVAPITLRAGTQRVTPIEIDLSGLAYNTAGAYPFQLRFDTRTLGAFAVTTRLAVAACLNLRQPVRIDGDLSDWPMAASNIAGDFVLVRGLRTDAPPDLADRPTLPTQAFFALDRERLYVAVRCRLRSGEPPLWRAENRVPMEGAVPWGQDVVELLLDPRPTTEGTPTDLYVLQIKPSGVVVARRGYPTDPPVGASTVWNSGAAVAAAIQGDVWIIELAVPLTSLGPDALTNRVWGANVTRLDARRGEYSSWSGAHGVCYSPRALGNLIVVRP
ncbi:MAG: DUF4091 domain-containing protein [Phycisphaerae bacterium]|jgi:hypothetical protein